MKRVMWVLAGMLGAFSLQAQELVWHQQNGAVPRYEKVRYAYGSVYVAGPGYVASLDTTNGSEWWSYNSVQVSQVHDLRIPGGSVLVAGAYDDGTNIHFAVEMISPPGVGLWSYVRPAATVYGGDNDAAFGAVECNGQVVAVGLVRTSLKDTLLVVGLDAVSGGVNWEFVDTSTATNAAKGVVCLPGGDVAVAAVFRDTAYVYRLSASGNPVWKRSLGHVVRVEENVLGIALDGAGNLVVVGAEWDGALTYRMFATALDLNGQILWDYLHPSDSRIRAFAVRDSLIYAAGNAGDDHTYPVYAIALNTAGQFLWDRTSYSGIALHDAAVDTFGNLFLAGEDFGLYDTSGFLLALAPSGRKLFHNFTYGPVGEGALGVDAMGSEMLVVGRTYSSTRVASVARYHLLPYFVVDSLTWDDGGDRLPNTEGDPATGSLAIRWHGHVEGGQGDLNLYLSCTQCTELTLLDSLIQQTGLLPGDTFTLAYGATLGAGGDSFHLWLKEGLADTFDLTDTVLHVIPQVGNTPVFDIYDDTDDHYAQRPLFSWVDARTLGTPVAFSSGEALLALPRPFTLKGIQYDSVRVGGKGWVILGTGTSPNVGDTLPNGDPVPLFHVLYAPYHTYASAYVLSEPGRWVLEWYETGYAFEVVLDYGDTTDPADDEVRFQYLTLSAFPNVGDVGYQDATGQNGLTLAAMTSWGGQVTYKPFVYPLGDQRAIRFVPQGGGTYAVVADSARWLDGNNGAPGAGGDPSVTLRAYVHNAGDPTGPVWGTASCLDQGTGLCAAVHFSRSVDTLGILDSGAAGQLNFALSLDSTGRAGDTLHLQVVVHSPFAEDTLVTSWVLVNDVPPSGGPVVADSGRWLDGGDNQPGAAGDPSVTLRAYIHNAGTATGPVTGEVFCVDIGNGLCTALTFANSTDTLPSLGDNARDSLSFSLSLDSTGTPGETLRLRVIVTSPVNADTLMLTWALANDLTPPSPGGPESLMVGMGYTGIEPGDSTDLWMPALVWQEIDPARGGSGTLVSLTSGTGDDGRGPIPLPQPFYYDGTLFDTLWVSTNGWASPGSDPGTADYLPDPIPTADGKSVIAVLWKDLKFGNYGGDGGIYTFYRAADSTLVVEWSHVGRYGSVNDTVSFQLWLRFGDSSLVFLYRDTPSASYLGSSVTVGIENNAETDGIQVLSNGTYHPHAYPITAGHGIYFTPHPTTPVTEAGTAPRFALNFRGSALQLVLPRRARVYLVMEDLLGRQRYQVTREMGAGVHRLRLPVLPAGVYFLRLSDGHRQIQRKVLYLPR